MVAVSFVLVLALVSSTVVAQPGKNRIAGLVAYFKQRAAPMAPKTSTTSVYEWIPPRKWALKLTSNINSVKIGLKYILKQLDLQPNGFKVMTSFTDNLGITHVYGEPLHEGLPIGNLHAAAHVKNGQVFFHSATIMDDRRLTQRSPTIPESRAKLSSKEAVKAAVDYFKVPFHHDIAPVMEYYKTGNGHIPVWKFQLRDDPITQWFEVRVNANTGNNVWASTEGGKIFKTTTRGIFNMEFDPTSPPQTPKNLGAGGVNAFYVTNTFHDVFYAYGFNEPAGNFQQNNFDKGGRDGDPVIINVQISGETNNAYFHTPPDGYPGVLTLHIFTNTEPNRDPALDNTMLIHELTHGLNDRLTGGAHEDLCMTETESLGLGEGYSDMVALIFMAKPEDTRDTKKVIGEYVKGDPKGIRKYPYTTNMRFNPLTYKDAVGEKQRHALGEIWATMLLEVYWSLVDAYGFSANLHDATQKQGNIIFLQLLVGTMMIQPCNPTFESAYDAMLAADYAYYGGIHKHLIRKGFSKRGLGSIS
ncbi:hypothetical protein BASA83_013489 [Batrachochytrium salamandrivorans]|nr:hypothetical protein BASA83_013489 [Batrachochytrium salamandrivorans]